MCQWRITIVLSRVLSWLKQETGLLEWRGARSMMRCFNVLQPNITRSENGKIFCVSFSCLTFWCLFWIDKKKKLQGVSLRRVTVHTVANTLIIHTVITLSAGNFIAICERKCEKWKSWGMHRHHRRGSLLSSLLPLLLLLDFHMPMPIIVTASSDEGNSKNMWCP